MMAQCTAGIAGAGGLGSNCAVSLVRCGLGKLIICDYDHVEESNLNRQYYFRDQISKPKVDALKENLLRINPDIQVEARQIRLTPDNIPTVYQDVDVLIEAFDQADQKVILIDTALSVWPDRPLIVGSGMAGWGKNDSLEVRSSGNLLICGDGSSEVNQEAPPLAPRVGIVANLQANAALEILLNKKEI